MTKSVFRLMRLFCWVVESRAQHGCRQRGRWTEKTDISLSDNDGRGTGLFERRAGVFDFFSFVFGQRLDGLWVRHGELAGKRRIQGSRELLLLCCAGKSTLAALFVSSPGSKAKLWSEKEVWGPASKREEIATTARSQMPVTRR